MIVLFAGDGMSVVYIPVLRTIHLNLCGDLMCDIPCDCWGDALRFLDFHRNIEEYLGDPPRATIANAFDELANLLVKP